LALQQGAGGSSCLHLGLDHAPEAEIWHRAKKEALIIVTKDDDFRLLADRLERIPPQVVWVRLGNCRKQALLTAFESVLPQLRTALESGERIVEIR
jgi:predicted nuclease of predicted toxin-antitoxin system